MLVPLLQAEPSTPGRSHRSKITLFNDRFNKSQKVRFYLNNITSQNLTEPDQLHIGIESTQLFTTHQSE